VRATPRGHEEWSRHRVAAGYGAAGEHEALIGGKRRAGAVQQRSCRTPARADDQEERAACTAAISRGVVETMSTACDAW